MKNLFTTKNILVAFCLITALNAGLKAQTIRLGEIMLNSFMSGNNFGVQRNPTIGIVIGKRLEINAGPLFNRGFQKNTGGLVSARYSLVRDNESFNGHFRLSSIVTLQHMYNQSLSKGAVKCEEKMAFNMQNDESANFNDLRYKGWEAAAGIGLSYRFSFGMVMRAEAALCYYATNQQRHPEINTFHEKNGTSLRLGFGIGWSITRNAIPKASSNG